MSERTKIVKLFVSMRWLRRFRTRAALEKYQKKMLLKQMRYIKAHSPYFKDIKADSIEDFKDLPLMDKTIMMENFNRLNCVGIDRDQALEIAINGEKSRNFDEKLNGISVGLSSGTSGARGLFIISDEERAMWAGGVLAKFLPKGHILGHKIAFFLRADNNLYETIDSRAIKFRYFDIMKSMDENIRTLDVYQPTILVAPPSVLLLLADAQESSTLNVRPEKIVSVAEVLTKEDEARFKKVFGLEIIHQAYQCTEGFLGYVCEHGGFHINEDVVYLEKEYIDEERFVPVITDYMRKSQPIIRYRLNDILVEEHAKCPCGSPTTLIKRIEGREDDIFLFRGTDGDPVTVFPDFISRCVIYAQGVRNYRVVQTGEDSVVVYLDNMNEEIQRQIVGGFNALSQRMRFVPPNISFEEYKVDLTRKLKRVERRIK